MNTIYYVEKYLSYVCGLALLGPCSATRKQTLCAKAKLFVKCSELLGDKNERNLIKANII